MEYLIKGIMPGYEMFGVAVLADNIRDMETAEKKAEKFRNLGFAEVRIEEFRMPTAAEVINGFIKAVRV